MTVGAVVFVSLYVGCAISVLSFMARALLRDTREERAHGAAGLDCLDELPWKGWTLSTGWPGATCWRGCADLHRDDWWRAYLDKTCWPGCADLHREGWWMAYLDQDGSAAEEAEVLPLSAEERHPGRRQWAGRPELPSRTAGRGRAASEGTPPCGESVSPPSGRTSPRPRARVST